MLQTESPEQASADSDSLPIDLSGTDSGDTWTVIELLSDEDCRALLAAADTPMTAMELVETCDIPRATVYRKLNQLQAVGLIEPSKRVRKSGLPPTQYQRNVDTLRLRWG
ncbi:winged helix-turn-helix domain-containing protein [Haloglomus litoreum]|uniref:winged helix-turn-helix domain-containing protein n=1 Tax=Haloglomus litoreum TaxID=3034026 RepID=UPI0023E78C91|nr:helix-turn-helix domain-containing protein [Haloglomus sp. DT116]